MRDDVIGMQAFSVLFAYEPAFLAFERIAAKDRHSLRWCGQSARVEFAGFDHDPANLFGYLASRVATAVD